MDSECGIAYVLYRARRSHALSPSLPLPILLISEKIDTVKSLVQTDSIRRPRYHGFADGLKQALARGGGGFRGFFALYRGLSPAMVRAFIGNAVLFLTFESTMDAFGR